MNKHTAEQVFLRSEDVKYSAGIDSRLTPACAEDVYKMLREYATILSRQSDGPSEEDVESVGKALYIYWDDVNEQAKNAYRKKVRAALTAVWHNRTAQEKAEPVACWRYRNSLGEVVSEWVDGEPPQKLYDLCGQEITDCTIEVAYTAPPAERVKVPDNWYPTPENVNTLPQPLRDYVHRLETECDPSGTVNENALLREQTRQLGAMIDRLKRESAERVRVPNGWELVPLIGTTVKADHPITCLNPDEYFDVHEIQIGSTGVSVRGKNTCWFGLGLISAAPEADHHD